MIINITSTTKSMIAMSKPNNINADISKYTKEKMTKTESRKIAEKKNKA